MPLFVLAILCSLGVISANAQNGTWSDMTSGGLYSSGGNWLNGTVATGSSFTAFFNAVDITTDPTVVHLDASQTIGSIIFGDLNTSSAASWLVDNNGNPLNVLTIAGPTNIVVNSLGVGKQVTIGAILAGTTGMRKTGFGTLSLTNANTLTGNVSVNQGTLVLDYSSGASAVLLTQILSMGGGTLTVNGQANNASTQTFTSTTLNDGLNVINAVNGAGTGTATVVLGSLGNPAPGAAVEFIGPATTTAPTTINGNDGTVTTNGTITTTTGTANQTFNDGATGLNENETAYATVGLYDFATVSGGAVIGMSQGTGGTAGFGAYQLANNALPKASSLTTAYDIVGSLTLPANAFQYGGWRFNANARSTVTINQVTGASLLVTPNVGANNIEIIDGSGISGALEPGARNGSNAGSLMLWQNNTLGFLQLDTRTLYDGKTLGSAFVQNGPGTIFYIGTNGYTGPTYINNGTALITTGFSFGTNTGSGINGTAFLNGGTIIAPTNNVTLDNAGANTNKRPVVLGNNGGGLGAGAGFTLTVDGIVSGSGPLMIGLPPSSANSFSTSGRIAGTGAGTANATEWDAAGTVLLSGANTYSGGVILYSGALTAAPGSLGIGGYTFSGGTFKWPASTIDDLSGQTVSFNSAGGTLDLNGNNETLNNSVGNGGPGGFTTISSTGSGVLNLDSATGNVYSGTTTVGPNTTLNANNTSGSATGSGPVIVNGTLAGPGSISGPVTVGVTGQTFPSAGSGGTTTTLDGNLTYTSGAAAPTNANFALSSSASSSGNDQIALSGASTVLTPNGVSIGIDCGATLDTVNPYVLYNLTGGATLSGSFNPFPVWLKTTPANAGNYVIAVLGNQVVLVFTLFPTITSAALVPSTTSANQTFNINATVTQGSDTFPVASVTANLSSIGLGSSVSIPSVGGNNYSVTETVPFTVSPGIYPFVITAKDSHVGFANSNLTLTVTVPTGTSGASSQTWDGGGSDNLWSDAANWTDNLAPGFGDNLYFDGSTDLNPVMNNSYSMAGVTFNSTASAFNITASGGGTLSVTGGVTNLSSHAQVLNLPVSVAAATVPVSAGASGVVLSGVVSGPSTNNLSTSGSVTLGNANSFNGTTVVSSGTLLLGNSLALQNSTLDNVAGSVSFGTLPSASIGALTGSQNLVLKNTTTAVNLTLGNNSTSTFTGGLGDNGLDANVTMSGTGTQILSGNNTYLGTTTINNGATLSIGGSGQLDGGNYANTIANAGIFNYNSSVPQNLSGNISGAGLISQTGAGALTLSFADTYTGNTSIGANSTLIIGGAGQLGAGTYTANIIDNGALTYASSQPQLISGTISGSGGLNQNGTGVLTLNNANSFTGVTTIGAGSILALDVPGGLQGSTLNYNGTGTLEFTNGIATAILGALEGSEDLILTNNTDAVVSLTVGGNGATTTYSGQINDTGLGATLTKGGGGTFTLNGNSTYSGITFITGGTLVIGPTGQLSSGNYPAGISCNGVALDYASSLDQVITGQMSGNNSVINITGTGTLILANNGTENIFETGGSLGLFSGGLAISNTASLNGAPGNMAFPFTNNGTFTYSSSTAQTISGLLTGNGSIVENGSGKLTLSGTTNTYSGSVVINSGGVVSIGADTNLGVFPASPTTNIFLNGGDLLNTGSAVTLNSNRVIGIGPTSGNAGATGFIDTTGATFTVAGAIKSAGNTGVNFLDINTVTGTGTVALAGANTFTGDITVNAGTLSVTGAGDLGLGSFPGALNINGVGFNYASSASQTLSGTVTGNGNLLVTGAGPLTLLGANSYFGNTSVSAVGTLTLGSTGQLANGTYSANITNNGVLNFNNPSGQTVSGEISGTGSTTVNAGTLTLTGVLPAITSSNITVSQGAVLDVSAVSSFALNNQNLLGSGNINGSVTANSGSGIYAGLNGTYGTNTFNNNLVFAGSSAAFFDLGTNHSGTNDLIIVDGNLTFNGNTIHLKAPSTNSTLDSADYVLFTVTGNITNSPATAPVWDVLPLNPFNYSVIVSGHSVLLHFTVGVAIPPSGVASINPSSLYTDQGGLVTVTVTPGSSPTISSVTVDESDLFGTPTSLTLNKQSADVFTNTLVIPNNNLSGPYTLGVHITDSLGSTAGANLALNVIAGHLWNGLGADQNWGTALNWVGNAAPNLLGDSVTFDGVNHTNANMNNNYSIVGLTFDSTAGLFNIGATIGDTLSVSNLVINASSNLETLNLPIVATAPITIDAFKANLAFGTNSSLDNGGFALTVTDGGHNTTFQGPITDNGDLDMNGTGTLTLLSGANSYFGNTVINSGTLVIGISGELGFGDYNGAITNDGTLDYNSTNFQSFTGVISGSGPLNVICVPPFTPTLNNELVLSGASTFTNNVTISNAYLSVQGPNEGSAGAATVSGLGNPQIAGRTITINNNGFLSIDTANAFSAGANAPLFSIIVNQGGVLQATVANTAIGPLTLNGGTVQLLDQSTPATLQFEPIELGGSVTVGGRSASLMTNVGNLGGGANLTVNTTGTSQTTFNVASTGAAGPDLTVALPLADSGSSLSSAGLIKAGPGTMALTGTNIYTGVTTISAGILNLGVAETPGVGGPLGFSASFNPGSILFAGGTLQYSAANNNDYSGRFSSASAQPFIIDTAGQSVTFATPLNSSGGSLTKLGAGVLSLAAASTYSGSTTVSAGFLVLASGGSIAGTSGISIAAGATLNTSGQSTFTLGVGATLTASGTASQASIVGKTINLGSDPIILNYDGSHPALTIPSGTLKLNGNPITVNGSPLSLGNHLIIQQTLGSIATNSSTYAVTGTAIGSGDAGTINVSGGNVFLSIVQSVNLAPPQMFFSTTPNSISIGWPTNLGWRLEYQSNSLGVGVSANPANWITYPNSTSVTNVDIPISPTNNVFFRMIYP